MKIFFILATIVILILVIVFILSLQTVRYRPGKLKAPPSFPQKSTSVKEFK